MNNHPISIPTPRKKPRSLMVLIPLPSGGMLHYEVHLFLKHLERLYADMGVNFHEQIFAGLDQSQCRAELLALYYKHRDKYEDVLFLDSDTVVAPQVVVELGILETPIVAVPYEARRRDSQKYQEGSIAHWAVDTAGIVRHVEIIEGRRMMACAGAGLGCTRIRRHAIETMWEHARIHNIGDKFAPMWESHFPGLEGTEVCGLFDPVVHEHVKGSGKMRRRPDDMSFFLRAAKLDFTCYLLCDPAVWHDGKGGISLWDALTNADREQKKMRKRVDFELADCPDNLLGLSQVLDGAYEIPGLELGEGDTILDIGANIGAFAVWASKRFPGASINCYEPEPENYARLQTNLHAAGVNATSHRCAVTGDDRDRVQLVPGAYNDGEWSIHPTASHKRDRAIEVPAMSAAALPPCSVLKADTEGCELEILRNYPHLEHCKAVMLEWHSGPEYARIHSLMAEKGFVPMVDKARGRSGPDRELCFMHRDAFTQKANEQARELAPAQRTELNGGAAHP